jgi:hypothetical protein
MSDAVGYEVSEDEVMQDIDDAPEIELIDDDTYDDGPVPEEKPDYAAELARRQAELQERLASREGDTASVFKELNETLKSMRQEKPKEVAKEFEELDAFEKRIADGFYDNPVKAVREYATRVLEEFKERELKPALQHMGKVVRDTTLQTGKQAANDETSKFVLDKYYDEVRDLIDSGQIQIGPDAYKQAIGRVAANHIDEVIEAKIAAKAVAQPTAVPEAKGRVPSSTSGAPRPDGAVKLTRRAYNVLTEEARLKSIDEEAYRNWVVRSDPERIRKLNKGA